MVEITHVEPGGIAAQLELAAGDRIVAVNGEPVRDFLDVLIAEQLMDVTLAVEKMLSGEVWELEIEKESTDPFGLQLEHPEPKRCGNNCIFCFVHQMPKGMRRTLYVKDEDYRFSYLYGAYITLSNLDESDFVRIIAQKLSPLYISVHAVDEAVRTKLLGRLRPPVLPLLKRLVDAGIELHTQVVVCPGVNDGDVLTQTVEALAALGHGVRSLALVPVGLTEHRSDLASLRAVSKAEAGLLLDQLEGWQSRFLKSLDTRFVYAADEYYLKAERPIPHLCEYEDLPQVENGVGMIALFRDQAEELLREIEGVSCPVVFSVVTGHAFCQELQSFLEKLSAMTGCSGHLYRITNRLFGEAVTVAGLVTGGDIAGQLAGQNLGSALMVPDVMMRDGDEHFLDDMTPQQLGERLGCRVQVIPSTPWGVLDAIEALASE